MRHVLQRIKHHFVTDDHTVVGRSVFRSITHMIFVFRMTNNEQNAGAGFRRQRGRRRRESARAAVRQPRPCQGIRVPFCTMVFYSSICTEYSLVGNDVLCSVYFVVFQQHGFSHKGRYLSSLSLSPLFLLLYLSRSLVALCCTSTVPALKKVPV